MPDEKARPEGRRQRKGAARREAILDAALSEFTTEGYARARMEDIARRAGVAKGTLFLYFKDKEGLFIGLAESALLPLHARAQEIMADDTLPLREKLLRVYAPMTEAQGCTRSAAIIRLLWAEGLHNPALAGTFYRNLLAPIVALHRETVRRAAPEEAHPALRAFPQLLMSPIIHGQLWQGMFRETDPLDIEGMFRAYLDMVLPEKP